MSFLDPQSYPADDSDHDDGYVLTAKAQETVAEWFSQLYPRGYQITTEAGLQEAVSFLIAQELTAMSYDLTAALLMIAIEAYHFPELGWPSWVSNCFDN